MLQYFRSLRTLLQQTLAHHENERASITRESGTGLLDTIMGLALIGIMAAACLPFIMASIDSSANERILGEAMSLANTQSDLGRLFSPTNDDCNTASIPSASENADVRVKSTTLSCVPSTDFDYSMGYYTVSVERISDGQVIYTQPSKIVLHTPPAH